MNRNKYFLNSNDCSEPKLIYVFTGVFLSALFLIMLYHYIVTSFFEQDLVWLIPMVAREIKGASFIKLIVYFLDVTSKWFVIPTQKLYTFFVLSIFGPLAKNFIFISIFFHFCCSVLLFLVCRELRLSSRISFLSAAMYLTFFVHFHAYIWAFGFLHLIVVFFVLLGLFFYLKTDRLINEGVKYRNFYLFTLLVNLFASFCRYSILILPAMIFSHIIFCSKDRAERIKKYDIWMPLFIIYLIYPSVVFVSGENRILAFFLPLNSLLRNSIGPHFPLAKINIPIKFFILFLLGICGLLIFRSILVIYYRYNLKKLLKWALITGAVAITAILISFGGPKRLLIPYNVMAPFIGTLTSFVHPLQASLLVDPTMPYYFIPFQLDLFNFMIGLSVIIIFYRQFIVKNKSLIILGVWYLLSAAYLYFRNPLVSRYFIFLSPLFCIIFASVLDYLSGCVLDSTKLKTKSKEAIIVFTLLILCIPNLLAIKLALFRGKLANTFLTYDYVRAAYLIKQDLLRNGSLHTLKGKAIHINNILPIDIYGDKNFSFSDTYNENVKFVFMQAMNDVSLKIKINEVPGNNNESLLYSLENDRINNAEGLNINQFSRFFEQAEKQLESKNYLAAIDLFNKAIEEKPFLFKYILSGQRMDDLEWITNKGRLRSQIDNIGSLHTIGCSEKEIERTRYILSIMHKEIDEYIQCFFYLSYLKFTFGDAQESKLFFSKIRFLESDFKSLNFLLRQLPLVKSDRSIYEFLDRLDYASLYIPHDFYKERYKFEKFIFNLVFKT